MIGKVVQLLGVPLEGGFQVVYGLDVDFETLHGRVSFNFGTISFANLGSQASRTFIRGGHLISDQQDGLKEIIIFNNALSPKDVEDYLLVIVPHATQIVTTATKLAGRYSNEAVLEMHEGDTVEVSKNRTGKRIVYIVAKGGNELFLIKKNR